MAQVSPVHASDTAYAVRYKTRLGLVLCIAYAVAYVGFVATAVYDVTLMDTRMPFGLNLGAFWGFGLIVLAFVLGLVYNYACGRRERSTKNTAEPRS